MAQTTESSGGASQIAINAIEVTNMANQLTKVLHEMEAHTLVAIQKIGKSNFYLEGKAKEAMDVQKQANEKVLEMYVHYQRAQTLVIQTLDEMIKKDGEIAEQIFNKLEI